MKNFSLLEQPPVGMVLSPAYDLINMALVNPADEEEMALTLNGRKKKLKKQDFTTAMHTLKLGAKQQENMFNKMAKALPKWFIQIDRSFMSTERKEQYKAMVTERIKRLV